MEVVNQFEYNAQKLASPSRLNFEKIISTQFYPPHCLSDVKFPLKFVEKSEKYNFSFVTALPSSASPWQLRDKVTSFEGRLNFNLNLKFKL